MRFRLTFAHGVSRVFEADRLSDDGNALELWAGDELVQRVQDSDIASCERLEAAGIEAGDTYGRRGGCRLYDADGALVAAYRTEKAARK